MRESVFKSSFRLFFLALSSVIGMFTGMLIVVFIIAGMTDTQEKSAEISYEYDAKIAPNALNVRKELSSSYPVILKINITGEIGTETLNRKTIESLLVESRERSLKDNRVKAIILSINTPGGTVTDASAIYHALKSYKEQYKTPIYAHVDGLCASGGMYVACAADKIYTSDASILGSVGVLIGPFMNFYKLMETYGIAAETITAGTDKDAMSPFRKWSDNESENFKSLTDYFYNHFIDIVAAHRPLLTPEKLRGEYGARVFPAKQAEEYGFSDGSNYSFNQALALLAKEIGIDDDMYQVIELEGSGWLASLLKGKVNLGLLTGDVRHRLSLPPQLNPEFMNQPLYLYRPE